MSGRTSILFVNSPVPYPTPSIWRAAINLYGAKYWDGDTLWVQRDSGCREDGLIQLRVTGINFRSFNAPERYTPIGKQMIAHMESTLTRHGSQVVVITRPSAETEKYGRWLSPVFLPNDGRVQSPPSECVVAGETLAPALTGMTLLSLAELLDGLYPGSCVWDQF